MKHGSVISSQIQIRPAEETQEMPIAAAVLILAGIFDLVLVFILRRKCLIVLRTFHN